MTHGIDAGAILAALVFGICFGAYLVYANSPDWTSGMDENDDYFIHIMDSRPNSMNWQANAYVVRMLPETKKACIVYLHALLEKLPNLRIIGPVKEFENRQLPRITTAQFMDAVNRWLEPNA